MGNATDEQDYRVALVPVTGAAGVVVLWEEGSNSDAGLNFSYGTISIDGGIIPVHSEPLAPRPSEAVLHHASEKIAENLAFVMCSFGCNVLRKITFIKNEDVGLRARERSHSRPFVPKYSTTFPIIKS
jgi:hypothetical protein